MSKGIFESVLYDALPDSIRDDENVRAIASALDGEIRRMFAATIDSQWTDSVIDETLSGAILDHIAWSWGSVVWDRDWTEEQKRSYAIGLLSRKMKLGTAECIRDAFRTIGMDVEVLDNMKTSDIDIPDGMFLLFTDDPIKMASQWRMQHIIDRIKPASRHYLWGHRVPSESTLYASCGATSMLIARFDFDAQYNPVPPVVQEPVAGGILAVTDEGTTSEMRAITTGLITYDYSLTSTEMPTGILTVDE